MAGDPRDIVREDVALALDPVVGALGALRGRAVTVTGGTGFAGTWVAEAITHLNDVHGFGTSLSLLSRSADRFALEHPDLASRPEIRLVKGDVRHAPDVPRDTAYLLHAAANPDTRFHASHPVQTMQTIAEGTAAVLQAVRNASDLRMVVNLSSALAVGTQPATIDELGEDQHGAPAAGSASSAYAAAKRYGETLCAAVRSQDHLPVLTVRPFALVGPFQSLSSPWALNTFLREALAGDPIRVLGSGRTVRSYLYGSDLATWLLRIAVAGRSGDCLNVGSPEAVDLETLARAVARHVEPEPDIILNFGRGVTSPEDRLVPDVSRAQSLGLSVTVPLEEALSRTVRWHRVRSGVASS